jgi:hypothetical protein
MIAMYMLKSHMYTLDIHLKTICNARNKKKWFFIYGSNPELFIRSYENGLVSIQFLLIAKSFYSSICLSIIAIFCLIFTSFIIFHKVSSNLKLSLNSTERSCLRQRTRYIFQKIILQNFSVFSS